MTRRFRFRAAWLASAAVAAWAQVPPPTGVQGEALEAVCVRHASEAEAAAVQPLRPPMPAQMMQPLRAAAVFPAAAAPSYTLKQLSAMPYPDLVATLSGTTWDRVTDLWTWSPDAAAFYGDQARMTALIDALAARCAQYTADDAKGIPTLAEVIRAGFYQAFYHTDALAYLGRTDFKDTTFPAIRAAQANAAFGLGTAAQDKVVTALGLLISDGTCDPGIVNGFTPVLKQVADNFEAYAGDYAKGNAAYNVLNGIDYDLTWIYLRGGSDVASTAFYKAIDPYLDQVFRLGTYPNYTAKDGWLIDAAVWYVGYDGRFHSTPDRGLRILTDAVRTYGSTPWRFPSAQAAQIIAQKYGGRDADGNAVDWNAVQQAIRAQYTPVKRDFEGGIFRTQTGTQVDPQKVKTLIWAHKETRAQFFRALRRDLPVDPGHHQDDALTMVIYDSPDAYRMNRFAYGLSTSNGGIMIESLGTFFTYERTPQQSYYTLEELFRHEGVHYLQGRFEEPGFFGDAPLYSRERLTWLDEGSAEFFAGATRTRSVQPRYIKAHLIQGYDPATWYSIDQVTRATYASGWTFYDYASELVDYLYHGPWDRYLAMLDKVRAGDGDGFSALCAQDAADGTLSAGYRDWLTYLSSHAASFASPSTSPDYLAVIPPKPQSEVTAEITAAAGLTGVSVGTTSGGDWDTFTLRGAYDAGPAQATALDDWRAMDAKANAWLETLTARSWAGWKTLTCWFVNDRRDGAGHVVWDVAFHGVRTDGAVVPGMPSVASFAPASGPRGTLVTLTGSGFSGATAVSFGGRAAASFSVVDDRTITATVPAGALSGPVRVATGAGAGASAARFLAPDLDDDGRLSVLDMGPMAFAYGSAGRGDLDGDGVIGEADLAMLLRALP